MHVLRAAVLVLSLALFAVADAGAQETSGRAATGRFEVTPFLGFRLGGTFDIIGTGESVDVESDFSYALALDLRSDATSHYELFYSRQPTNVRAGPAFSGADLDVEYLLLGGTLTLSESQFVHPYIVAAIGAGRLSLDAPDADDQTKLAFSFGAGIRMPLNARVAIRLEARGYLTLVDTDSSAFCSSETSGGACALRGKGSSFTQFELLAGAAFTF